MEPSDEALISACRRGDAVAWEALSVRYRGLVFTICRRAGLDREQAADVCQNVFAILAENLDRIEQPAKIDAWLVTTARREAWNLDRRERAARGSMDYDEHAVDALADDTLPTDELILRLEAQNTVRTAVATLDERCRRLLTLLFYWPDPAPYAEIAAALGIPEGSIGPFRARCLRKLRRILGDLEF
jgi:RNA polymerase sigma factor (sigma-70 family)